MDPLGIGPCNPLCASVGKLGDRGCFSCRDPSVFRNSAVDRFGFGCDFPRLTNSSLVLPHPFGAGYGQGERGRGGAIIRACISHCRAGMGSAPCGTAGIAGTGSSLCCWECCLLPTPRPHTAWASYFLILLLLRAGRAGCWQLSGIRGPLGTPGQRGQDRQLCSR